MNEAQLRGYKKTAAETGLSEWMLRSLVWSGSLPVVKIGKKHFLDRRDVDRLIAEKKTFQTEPACLKSPKRQERFENIKQGRAGK